MADETIPSKFDPDSFWAALAVQREEVTGLLPQYAGKLFLRTLDADGQVAFEEFGDKLEAEEPSAATRGMLCMLKVLTLTLEDETGDLCFGEEAIPKMRRTNSKAVFKLARRAMRLSGLSAVDVGNLEKKSAAAATSG